MVCYLERGPGGSTLRRVRLVGAAFDRSWSAPVAGEIGSGSPGGGGEGAAAVAAVRAGARWVAQTLKGLGTSRLDILCLDGEGGVCTWLSAPTPEQRVVNATIQQSVLSGGEGAGGSAGRLIAIGIATGAGAGLESDVSVQALAVEEPPEPAAGGGRGLRLALPGRRAGRGGGKDAGGSRERFAVISVRDGAARVFIDELDARGIDVGSVESIWHALASGWDPGAARPGPDESEALPGAPLCALVMTDPAGRLVWSWSRGGELLAAGQARLRHVSHRVERAAAPALMEPDALAVAEPGAARRVHEPEADEAEGLECTPSEIGRLVMDWLAWSAQLGRTPERVVCFGPATMPAPEAAAGTGEWLGGPTPASLAEGLGRAWGGAPIDAAVHDDPIGATLTRLAGVGPLGAQPPKPPGAAQEDDPRRELLGLGARPGRVDKWMYRWTAVGLAAAALVIAAAGWQFHRAAGGGQDEIADAQKRKSEALLGADEVIPNVSKHPDPAGLLVAKVRELEEVNKSLKAQRPMLAELARVFKALEGAPEGTKLQELTLNPAVGSARLLVPDSDTGPGILARLRELPGEMPWRGSTPPTGAGAERRYMLTGAWPTESPPGGGRP